jgi:8-oxo-dGTP diphosphatase
MKKYCLGFMFNEKETDVLLIEKQKPFWQKGKFNGLGGEIEGNETSNDAMSREFKEESGIDTNTDEWKYVIAMSRQDWRVDVFTCKSDNVFDFKTKTNESVNLIPLLELDKYDIIYNLHWLIQMCLERDLKYTITNYGQSEI